VRESLGLEVPSCGRPLAADDAPMLPVVQHALEAMKERGSTRTCGVAAADSPLRRAEHIDAGSTGRAHRCGFDGLRRRGTTPVQSGVGDATRRRPPQAVFDADADEAPGQAARVRAKRSSVLAVRAAVVASGSLYGERSWPSG